MSESEAHWGPLLDRCLLEARAAHVYIDAAESAVEAPRRARNLACAREVLDRLDAYLGAPIGDDDVRRRVQELRLQLSDRLARTPD